MLNATRIKRFQRKILSFYRLQGRDFPWRRTRRAYHIFVSEIMLQQTQTDRVAQKYREFLRAFPSFAALAEARTASVLRVWQGLGYNRRALALQGAARIIHEQYGGRLPRSAEALEGLPGVGPYTAAAIRCFAWNASDVLIETNIRAVFIAEFFPESAIVRDEEILPLIAATIYRHDPRTWYYALMDYGVEIKRRHRGIGKRSAHYVRQSPFRGSRREIRGRVLRMLSERSRMSKAEIYAELRLSERAAAEILESLATEGFLTLRNGFVTLRS